VRPVTDPVRGKLSPPLGRVCSTPRPSPRGQGSRATGPRPHKPGRVVNRRCPRARLPPGPGQPQPTIGAGGMQLALPTPCHQHQPGEQPVRPTPYRKDVVRAPGPLLLYASVHSQGRPARGTRAAWGVPPRSSMRSSGDLAVGGRIITSSATADRDHPVPLVLLESPVTAGGPGPPERGGSSSSVASSSGRRPREKTRVAATPRARYPLADLATSTGLGRFHHPPRHPTARARRERRRARHPAPRAGSTSRWRLWVSPCWWALYAGRGRRACRWRAVVLHIVVEPAAPAPRPS